MHLKIKRISMGDKATFGVLLDTYDVPFALTGERAWLGNASGVSCIPAGNYTCNRVQSPHFGDVFEVSNVPNRGHILFHKGNIPEHDSRGCILVGEQFGYLDGEPAVLASGKGFNEFMDMLSSVDSFALTITEV